MLEIGYSRMERLDNEAPLVRVRARAPPAPRARLSASLCCMRCCTTANRACSTACAGPEVMPRPAA
jgi:hypothetical protein